MIEMINKRLHNERSRLAASSKNFLVSYFCLSYNLRSILKDDDKASMVFIWRVSQFAKLLQLSKTVGLFLLVRLKWVSVVL